MTVVIMSAEGSSSAKTPWSRLHTVMTGALLNFLLFLKVAFYTTTFTNFNINRSFRKPMSVVLGTHNLKRKRMRRAVKKCKHQHFTSPGNGNDIMLLKVRFY